MSRTDKHTNCSEHEVLLMLPLVLLRRRFEARPLDVSLHTKEWLTTENIWLRRKIKKNFLYNIIK